MTRTYVVFGSNDGGKTLVPVGEFEASDHDAAKKKARDAIGADSKQPLGGYEAYGSCPVGNWSFGKLTVKEIVEVEEVPLPLPHQLTVDDVLSEQKAEDAKLLSRDDVKKGLSEALADQTVEMPPLD